MLLTNFVKRYKLSIIFGLGRLEEAKDHGDRRLIVFLN